MKDCGTNVHSIFLDKNIFNILHTFTINCGLFALNLVAKLSKQVTEKFAQNQSPFLCSLHPKPYLCITILS